MHLVITDSGLGGLSICAALERRVRQSAAAPATTLTYVNAWPEEGRGYNDLPDTAARAAAFDRALDRMAAFEPDGVLIACNTLSILYARTRFSLAPAVPVSGIVEAGVRVFAEALTAEPAGSIVLLGTRTTIESGTHRDELVSRGIAASRIAGVACHGLAGAIERDVDGPRVGELIDACAGDAGRLAPGGGPVFVGLCCTHYGYAAARIGAALTRTLGTPVRLLDPNQRMVADFELGRGAPPGPEGGRDVVVKVMSKVVLDDRARQGISRLVAPVSPVTARALLSYAHVPDLF